MPQKPIHQVAGTTCGLPYLGPRITLQSGADIHPESFMRKSKFSKSEFVKTLKEADGGRGPRNRFAASWGYRSRPSVTGRASTAAWRQADIRRLRELEDEKAKLKHLYAELAPENNALKVVISKCCNPGRAAGPG